MDYLIQTEAGNRTLRVCPHQAGWKARIEISDIDDLGHEAHRSAMDLSNDQWDELVQRVEGKSIYEELVMAAAGLVSENGENGEYDRALAELIADTRWGAVKDMGHGDRVAQVLTEIRKATEV